MFARKYGWNLFIKRKGFNLNFTLIYTASSKLFGTNIDFFHVANFIPSNDPPIQFPVNLLLT